MKHNTAHSPAADIRKNQVLEALGGKAFRGTTPLSFAGLIFLPHLVGFASSGGCWGDLLPGAPTLPF